MTTDANAGAGPGPITPDGCAVDLYALLPPGGEAEIAHEAIPAGSAVLELGCGTGRILRRLAELGHSVVGVDESPDMLAYAVGLDTVCSPIQTLDLRRGFDAVLLASALINTADQELRTAMLRTARRHTVASGSLVVQRHPTDWFDTLVPSSEEQDGIRFSVGAVERDGPLLTTTIEYQVGRRRWTHSFTACRLTDDDVTAALYGAEFGHIRWLTEDHSWLAATATT
ncbi:class I SAM-dependent methyltransferase [Asanoa sp. NPDC049518]|uniref:class I SAM-dependent methyltransferase n=1 Tax=unclassified Asanoa TaxID=2685164 RepID=UPI00341EEC77